MGRRPQPSPYRPHKRTVHRVQLDLSFTDDGTYSTRVLKWDNGRVTMGRLDDGLYLDMGDRYCAALLKRAMDGLYAQCERGDGLLL